MCGALFRSAIACTCISVAFAAHAATPQDAAALEVALSRQPGVYLVVDAGASRLSIRSRAMELDSVPLAAIRVAWQGQGVTAGPPPTVEVPAVWHVTEAPTGDWRRVVAPVELAPYSDAGPVRDSGESVRPTPTPGPILPDRFVALTDTGWRLAVTTSLRDVVPVGFWRRIARGWRRVFHQADPPMPPTLVLVVTDQEDAHRLVHLFRQGAAVLLVDASAGASAATAP